MDAAAELGRNPASKHQNQPEYGDEQADAGRDCRIRLARPNSRARTGNSYFPVQLTTSRIGNLSRLIHTLAICVTIHTHRCSITRVLYYTTLYCGGGSCRSGGDHLWHWYEGREKDGVALNARSRHTGSWDLRVCVPYAFETKDTRLSL